MGRRGRKRQLVVEDEYWALVLAGVRPRSRRRWNACPPQPWRQTLDRAVRQLRILNLAPG
jgi:hypothetical protein